MIALQRDQRGYVNIGGGRKLPPGWTLLSLRSDEVVAADASVTYAAKKLGIKYETAVRYTKAAWGSGFDCRVVGILVPDDQAEDVANIALARDRSVERHLTPEQRAQLNDLLREIPGGA